MKSELLKALDIIEEFDTIDKEADEYFDSVGFAKKKISQHHESCKCVVASDNWEKHEQHCPVWKNGRIAELEELLDKYIKRVSKMYCVNAGGFEGPETYPDCGVCIVCKTKDITKNEAKRIPRKTKPTSV